VQTKPEKHQAKPGRPNHGGNTGRDKKTGHTS
jgi:hypothetical protein